MLKIIVKNIYFFSALAIVMSSVELMLILYSPSHTTSNYSDSISHTIEAHRTILPPNLKFLTLTVLVTTIDAQWEGMGDVGSARYEPALLPPCPTIKVLSYSN